MNLKSGSEMKNLSHFPKADIRFWQPPFSTHRTLPMVNASHWVRPVLKNKREARALSYKTVNVEL